MLASAEVGTLITALGCGIGRDEYNPDKLRYHSIIIMTDADVDGSHIRTLLLTFFYRQMPELIERGHVYIAQPPLYRVKKGKHEQYIKDDEALDSFLLNLAMEDTKFYSFEGAPAICGEGLEGIIYNVSRAIRSIDRLAIRYPKSVLEGLIYVKPLSSHDLSSKDVVQTWVEDVSEYLVKNNQQHGACIALDITHDQDADIYLPVIKQTNHGITKTFTLNTDFFNSQDYSQLALLFEQVNGLIEPGAYLTRGEKSTPIQDMTEMLDWLLHEAKKGLTISRYKGLGEMNPDQLWDTTMNPETRHLLQVNVEDAIVADEAFTTLMGDQVEPRRKFIEDNALDATNIDV